MSERSGAMDAENQSIEPGVSPSPSTGRGPGGRVRWETVVDRLERAHTYWLATARAGGRPHVMPVWAVWLDGALWLSTSAQSTKGRNLAREPRCTLTLDDAGMQLVVDGTSRRITADAELQRFVAVYTPKYGWSMTIRDGAVHFEDGNSGYVYAVRAETVFAFVEEPFTSSRWRF